MIAADLNNQSVVAFCFAYKLLTLHSLVVCALNMHLMHKLRVPFMRYNLQFRRIPFHSMSLLWTLAARH